MARPPSHRPVNDIMLAVFSLALGVIVWAIVRQNEIQIQTKLVPVNLINVPEFVQLKQENPFEPDRLPVNFSFRKADEAFTASSEFEVTADLEEISVRSTDFAGYRLTVDHRDLEYPPQLSFVEFAAEPVITIHGRLMMVRARVNPTILSGEPAEGYRIDTEDIIVNPPEILVAVDYARYQAAQTQTLEVETDPIDISGAKKTVSEKVSVQFQKEGIFENPIAESPDYGVVEVYIPVREITETRVFDDFPINFQASKAGRTAELTPSVADITVSGPRSLVNNLTSEMIILRPRDNEFIDEERIGEVVETLLDVKIDSSDARYERELRMKVEPAKVRVRFESTEPPAEVEPQVLESAPAPAAEGPRELEPLPSSEASDQPTSPAVPAPDSPAPQ